MSEQLKLIKMDALWRRLFLLVPLALALLSVWFVTRWCFGNTLAGYPQDEETAQTAVRLAPDDPQTHFTLAVFKRKSFAPEELDEAVRGYERATSLSPNDYRLWLELGRVRGQTGDSEGGERALRRAAELAPNYAMPRWYLGNLLLRAGKQDEAFKELQHAAALDAGLLPQVFALAWSVFGGDVARVSETVGSSAQARAQLAEYLVKQKRIDEALQTWSSLSAGDKRAQGASGKNLMRALLEAKRFRAAQGVYREVSPETGEGLNTGQITNGGFESEIAAAGKNPFDWDVKNVPEVPLGLDTRNLHGGARSLRLTFTGRTSLTFSNISQLVVVEPATRYRLEYYVRTSDLKSVSTLVVEVLDGAQGAALVSSAQVPNGTQDWQQVTLDFTTPAQAEAITVRLNRPPCGEDICPIFGKIWYDDFSLQRSAAAGSGTRAEN